MLEICKWKYGANSPVLLMIDDLANVWIDTNGNGQVDPGEDWGYAKNRPNSAYSFLTGALLAFYPEVKTTFFTPVGERSGLLECSPLTRIAAPINADADSIAFFQSLQHQPRFEVAYHGTTHGKAGKDARQFTQEWELFQTLGQALTTVNAGKEIYRSVFGQDPAGGKYCGYVSNSLSDASIDGSGFTWWCRYWNRGVLDSPVSRIAGSDLNPLTAFDIKFFGVNQVIDIPSTLSGALFMDLLVPRLNTGKGLVKWALTPYLMHQRYREIDFLLRHQLVISIQEHIAPSRDDGQRQQPNIYDDLPSLKRIFDYLQTQNVWYCTGSELAAYVRIRSLAQLCKTGPGRFRLVESASQLPSVTVPEISLKVSRTTGEWIQTPGGERVAIKNQIATLPFQIGEYQIM
ncbi:MAG TPA: hypothetical protein VHY08_22845 [Bacillota bacterium]|nr:hypothetical protein [Bacillota bacterium]